MTIYDIINYLKEHSSLVFKYKSEYYSLQKKKSLFHSVYRLVGTDVPPQQRKSLEDLCEQVYISDDTLLCKAINYIEIPKWDDPAWASYEAVRHNVIVYNHEIHFLYNGRYYWIAHSHNGLSHLSDDLGNTQNFNSCRDLFENARIDGNTLKDIWGKVIVDAC